MSNIREARKALVSRILDGAGDAAREQRRAAFDNAGLTGPLSTLVDKVARHAHRVTDEDVGAARAAGSSEDQIYELVVCAAVGEATRQLEAALAAVAAAANGS
jgi:alkylhydroperoxidase family enzyme